MALIDLTRQAGAASTGSLLLTSTAVTSSVTGLYEVEWGKLNPTYALGQGDLTLGEGNKLSVGYLELENNIHTIYISSTNSINKGSYLLQTIFNDKNDNKNANI
mgnify:CR=1 FL=1